MDRGPIPRVLHQTWRPTSREVLLPRRLAALRESWRLHHPGWSLCVWSEADLDRLMERHAPHLLPTFRGDGDPIARGDLARFVLLDACGGVTCDIDVECFRPVDALLTAGTFVVGTEPARHDGADDADARGPAESLSLAWMAAPPGHTFTRRALDAVAVAAHEREGIEPRGAIVTRVYRAYRDPAPVTVVPALLHAFSRVDVERGLGKRFTPWDDARRHAYAGLRPHLSGRDGATPRVTLPCRIGAPDAVANEVEVARVASGPLVSCLMVTRDRFDEASRAVHAWRRQTHSDRELVIIDHGRDDRLARLVDRLDDPRIRTRRLRERHARLGDLRNRALAEARGELVALWDDDDLHHAQRIELQVLALQGTSADACFLPRWIMHWSRRARFALSQSRAWEGSMLAKRRLVPPYPSRRMAEDTPVVRALRERARVVYLDLPGLYVYRIHGANTWHDEHFERFWRDAARRFEGADAAAVALMLSQEHDLPTPIVPSPRERWRDAARHLRALLWQAREAVVTRLRGWRRD